ncbi:PAS domain-containing protein [Paucibacter oligotrophus]|uniref:histidine kinase n=1 Tax=Roseateles oligotrophus TaxID=1769250 RepID=A0ABT2Y8U9_9BURK|nr:PAS domain-containing protein [Roseateles oligotrophus]
MTEQLPSEELEPGAALPPAEEPLPFWLRPGFLLMAVLALVLLSLAGAAGFLRLQQVALETQALHETELYARVLVDHANRTLDTVDITLKSLAEVLQGEPDAKAQEAALANAVRALPFLRSLNLVDAEGRLLASSNPSNRDVQVGPALLAGQGRGNRAEVGTLLAGRDLADQNIRLPKQAAGSRWFIPLLWPLAAQGQRAPPSLLAVLNLDFFANNYELSLSGTPRAAALLQLDGRLITATEAIQMPSGQSAAQHQAFKAYLPAKEFGSFIAAGLDGQPAVSAFRSTRHAPWVIVVEQPFATVEAEFKQSLRQIGSALLALWLVIFGLALLAWRSLQAYRIARQERAQAAQGLSEQAAFTARLLDASPAPLFVTDASGRLLMVNRSWSEFTGFESQAVLGLALKDLRPELLPSAEAAGVAASAGQGFEVQLPDAQGRLRDVLVRRTPFAGGQWQATGHIGSLVDVSEYREIERRTLEAKEIAEQTSAMKTEFIANVSHELRTPLQSIIGFSELGLTRFPEQPKVGQSFQRIHGAGQRMLTLVNDLLDFSGTELLKGRLQLQRQRLLPLLESALGEQQEAADKAGIALHLSCQAPDLSAAVDSATFQQVLRKVLANALRFSERGSCVTLTLLPANAAGAAEGGVQLSIRDQGPGIPADELEGIFEPFVQSSRTKDGSGGKGLGLAICRRILDAHAGSIRAENHPDGGSIFIIELPALQD